MPLSFQMSRTTIPSDSNSIYKDAPAGEKVTSNPIEKYLDATFAPTVFSRTVCLCRGAWCSRPQQSVRAQHSLLGGGSQNQWRHVQTRMGLASLFGTWMAQHLNPFHQCLATLTLKSSLGQV
jgi:hypothetical protein